VTVLAVEEVISVMVMGAMGVEAMAAIERFFG